MNELVGGVELGGTKVVISVAREGDVLDELIVPTGPPGETLPSINRTLHGFQERHGRLAAIGLASFGPLAISDGRIARTPKPGWSGARLNELIGRGFDAPVLLDTDVNAAALAEGVWGASRDCRVHIYLTVGTGIGGGLIVDGKAVPGLSHPEMGHVAVRRSPGDRFAGICPFHGDCLEGLASGPAIAARTKLAGEEVTDAHPIWARVAYELAQLIASLMLTVAPHRIVIGGGVGVGRPFLISMIRHECSRILSGYGSFDPENSDIIVPASLGSRAGPLGALLLAWQHLSSEDLPGKEIKHPPFASFSRKM